MVEKYNVECARFNCKSPFRYCKQCVADNTITEKSTAVDPVSGLCEQHGGVKQDVDCSQREAKVPVVHRWLNGERVALPPPTPEVRDRTEQIAAAHRRMEQGGFFSGPSPKRGVHEDSKSRANEAPRKTNVPRNPKRLRRKPAEQFPVVETKMIVVEAPGPESIEESVPAQILEPAPVPEIPVDTMPESTERVNNAQDKGTVAPSIFSEQEVTVDEGSDTVTESVRDLWLFEEALELALIAVRQPWRLDELKQWGRARDRARIRKLMHELRVELKKVLAATR